MIGGKLETAHLDSCATHCYVSTDTSTQMTKRGYPPVISKILFDVEQGNPLCTTNTVHYLPVSMIREDGSVCHWDSCLFLVANAGAPIILCCPLLQQGGIIRYEPPPGYEDLLQQFNDIREIHSLQQHADNKNYRPASCDSFYGPPSTTNRRLAGLLLTDAAASKTGPGAVIRSRGAITDTSSGTTKTNPSTSTSTDSATDSASSTNTIVSTTDTTVDTSASNQHEITNETRITVETSLIANQKLNGPDALLRLTDSYKTVVMTTSSPISKQNVQATSLKRQKHAKGDTDMLTPENPYGRNPPLPEEVMEAIKHLKLLSDPKTTPIYTEAQIDEIRQRFKQERPRWAECLTMQNTSEIADTETEQYIYRMMDKPIYQKSIFSHMLDGVCDLKEYEINQKPGSDTWNPPQPKRFKSPVMVKIVDDWLDSLIEYKKVRESNATHPAMVTIVQKEGRDPRVCVDYRNRNSRSEIPVYPMPDVQDFLDEAAGFKYYCSFDMAKMFNQFRIKESHKHLAAFITHRGVYEPHVVLFGLAGGPQHAVRECGGAMAADPLTNGIDFTEWAKEQNAKGVQPPYEICPQSGVVKGSCLRPFIDDVNIPSNHKEGMIKLVENFFEFCKKHNLTLSHKKSKIMKTHLRMLGFVVSEKGKHLDPHRIVALLETAKPRSKETLHSMLSSYTFVRMFIPNFASTAAPLYEATKGIVWKGPLSGRSLGTRQIDPKFEWTPGMTRAYDQLRNALLEAPILVQVDWKYPLFLSVDASLRGEGWVLWQLITTSDAAKVAVAILYGSRKYGESEKNWETTRQEASAIRSALTDVYDYVFGNHFYLFSDHLNLRFMHNSVNRAVIRMRDFLSQFNMTVVHCPGIWNNADSLSRLETEGLPISLAQDLNSTTEAKMQGTSTLISTGTCTAEDPYTSSYSIQPRVIVATVLSTSATTRCTEHCFLCNVDTFTEDEYTEDEYYDEPVTELTDCSNNLKIPRRDNELAHFWCKRSTIPLEVHEQEASVWSERRTRDYKIILDDDIIPVDLDNDTNQENDEDLLWCAHIRRRSTVLISVGKRRPNPETFVPQNPSKRYGVANLHNQGKSVKKKVTFQEPQNYARTMHCSASPFIAVENRDEGTQTTPTDFRLATIKFPIIDDFLAIHNNESGHHGLDFSYRKLLKRCGSKWANERGEATRIKMQLKQFIDSCPICQKVKGLKEKIASKHSFIISRPFLEVSYDFIVFKREDKNGNRYLLVSIDNFLKLVEMKAVAHRDAETVANFLIELGARYGPMARLRSDKEGSFTGLLVSKINDVRGTESVPCIPYHPQANSICERQNAIIMDHLNALILGCKLGPESKVSWSDLIPFVFSLVNNTPKNPLGISPLSMIYGVFANYDKPLLPTTTANAPGNTSNPLEYFETLVAWQNQLLDVSEEFQSEHFNKLSKRFNKAGAETRQFNVGDFVLQHRKSTNISGKPCTRWVGPYLVLDRRDNDPTHPVLDLMDLTDTKVKEASIDDCRQFNTSWFDEEQLLPELVKLAAIDDNEYVVERIMSHKPPGPDRKLPLSKYLFEVKWKDFQETTWEPYSGLKDVEPLEEYAQKHPGLKLNIPVDN